MKRTYKELCMELLLFSTEDVLTLSADATDKDAKDDIFAPNN